MLRKETEKFPSSNNALHQIRIPSSHDFSYCNIEIKIDKFGVHEKEIEFTVEEDLLPYSLIKVESTMFERPFNFNLSLKSSKSVKLGGHMNKIQS